ncbi:hypothetical protein CgunFtcFv8_006023 [Champsocephalus gunnari]|uniref:Ig-like domain-containing protein n=1 Tax=Champsocephalus gunnari TaxID=52237 RepID=A0AAN8GW33_CHAGU|nr:hypothetical protein CgunFtcFv8_006023 [Champsocephalus gunnari]
MEATALCITLWMTVFLQLCEQKVDADVWIEPSRLQVFEYEPVSLRCVGFDEDSGDYWCAAGGKKSTYVNVIVTAGSVILESPVLPMMERESVTLSCRNKTTTSSILSAHFYKDGRLIRSSSTGNITIHRVSNSDEGLYKCSISDGGESPESWLTVRAKDSSSTLSPWIFVSVSLMVLLLSVGIHRFCKSYRHRAYDAAVFFCLSTKTPGSAEHHTEPSVAEDAFYSTISPVKM